MQIAAAQTKCASGTLPANGTGQCAAVQLWLACICRLDGLQPISNHGLEPALYAKLGDHSSDCRKWQCMQKQHRGRKRHGGWGLHLGFSPD